MAENNRRTTTFEDDDDGIVAGDGDIEDEPVTSVSSSNRDDGGGISAANSSSSNSRSSGDNASTSISSVEGVGTSDGDSETTPPQSSLFRNNNKTGMLDENECKYDEEQKKKAENAAEEAMKEEEEEEQGDGYDATDNGCLLLPRINNVVVAVESMLRLAFPNDETTAKSVVTKTNNMVKTMMDRFKGREVQLVSILSAMQKEKERCVNAAVVRNIRAAGAAVWDDSVSSSKRKRKKVGKVETKKKTEEGSNNNHNNSTTAAASTNTTSGINNDGRVVSASGPRSSNISAADGNNNRRETETGDCGDIYVRADGKRVRRVRKSSRTASSGHGEGEIYVRPDGKKVRRVRKSSKSKPTSTISHDEVYVRKSDDNKVRLVRRDSSSAAIAAREKRTAEYYPAGVEYLARLILPPDQVDKAVDVLTDQFKGRLYEMAVSSELLSTLSTMRDQQRRRTLQQATTTDGNGSLAISSGFHESGVIPRLNGFAESDARSPRVATGPSPRMGDPSPTLAPFRYEPGTVIFKEFVDPDTGKKRMYRGEVSVVSEYKGPYYRIIYEDGDCEGMTHAQVSKHASILAVGKECGNTEWKERGVRPKQQQPPRDEDRRCCTGMKRLWKCVKRRLLCRGNRYRTTVGKSSGSSTTSCTSACDGLDSSDGEIARGSSSINVKSPPPAEIEITSDKVKSLPREHSFVKSKKSPSQQHRCMILSWRPKKGVSLLSREIEVISCGSDSGDRRSTGGSVYDAGIPRDLLVTKDVSCILFVKDKQIIDSYGEHGIYTGALSKSTCMPHGKGRLEYDKCGRYYEGDWIHGRWTGYGKLSNGDGDVYEGGLKHDHKHGTGIMRFADGRLFEGEYIRGQMIQGKMTYQDGSVYEGSWVDGMRHGRGKCIFVDGSQYEGKFHEGNFHGHGKMAWADGGYYSGDWCDGEMHGEGKEVRPDGSVRHDGAWVRGQPKRSQSPG